MDVALGPSGSSGLSWVRVEESRSDGLDDQSSGAGLGFRVLDLGFRGLGFTV